MSNKEIRIGNIKIDSLNEMVTDPVFGNFCLNVLKDKFGAKNITELRGSTTYFDFKLNSRLNGEEGSTYFEYKTYIRDEIIDLMIDRFQKHTKRSNINYGEKPNVDFVLLLYSEPNQKIKKRKRLLNTNVHIWDLSDFAKIGGVYFDNQFSSLRDPEYYLTSLFSNELVQPFVKDSKLRSRNLDLESLKRCYSTKKMSIILGAGVSKAAQLPLWNELLDEMFLNTFVEKGLVGNQSDIESLMGMIKNEKDNPIIRAGYLRKIYQKESKEDKQYFDAMRNVLYRNVNLECNLLESLVNLCFPNNSKNCQVSRIITYNFDDLLEQTLNKREIQYNVIASREQMINDKRKLSVYHVHGFIPQNGTEQSKLRNVILSEEDYHRVYRDSFDWSNIVQANALFEDPCLFIGTSISDPNMRRILEYSSLENSENRHFALFQRTIFSLKDNIENTYLKEIYSNFKDRLLEMYLRKFNIRVIWYDDHVELPEIISKLAKSKESKNYMFFEDVNFRR